MPTFFERAKSAASAVKSAAKSAADAARKKLLERDLRLAKAAWKNEKDILQKGDKRTAYETAKKKLDDFNSNYQGVRLRL